MAFFKFRKASDATPAATAQPESVEALRRRARHRLIGAAILVLIGVIGFPLLFDTQPRPIAVDIPIEIPDRAKAKPLPPPPQSRVQGAVAQDGAAKVAAAPASAASQPVATSRAVSGAVARDAAPVAEAPKPVPAPQASADSPGKPAPETVKPAKAADVGATQAVRQDKPSRAQEADGRFVVQVGAFSDAGKARETRLRVEKAGLKTYTNVAETHDGKRIRVRVGPFGSRAEADKAASRIKALDLPASILTL
jgi:DedD protein